MNKFLEHRPASLVSDTVIYSLLEQPDDPFHPWRTHVLWDGNRWLALVAPGFVNYLPALVPMSDAEISAQNLPSVNGEVEIWDSPLIPLTELRDVGGEGDAIPGYFAGLGVRNPDTGFFIVDGDTVRVDSTDRPAAGGDLPPRALLAADLYVSAARATYTAHMTVGDPTATGETVDLSVSYDTGNLDRVGDRARLKLASKFEPVREPTQEERLLDASYSDDGEDRELLATVFFLAPAGVTSGPVGPDWEPMVQYSPSGCWNLLHDSPNRPPEGNTVKIQLFTGLAAGIGDSIVNGALAMQNDQAAAAAAAISVTNNKGFFWSM